MLVLCCVVWKRVSSHFSVYTLVMSSEIKWSRAAIEILIDEYRQHPCLWDPKSKLYKDRNAKMIACRSICNRLMCIYPHIVFNNEKIKKKIHTIRNQYGVQRNKVKSSKKSGSGFDTVYKPKLWFYDKMHFLNGVINEIRYSALDDDAVRFYFYFRHT